jgi:hypothetical protein
MFCFLALLLVVLFANDVTSVETSDVPDNPLSIRFSFGVYMNNIGKRLLLKTEKTIIDELEQREKERIERIRAEKEAKIYREHLVNRVQGSFVRDFLPFR